MRASDASMTRVAHMPASSQRGSRPIVRAERSGLRRSREGLVQYEHPPLRVARGAPRSANSSVGELWRVRAGQHAISGEKGVGERSIRTRERLPRMMTKWNPALVCPTEHSDTYT
jgi:hypothetical protein